MSWFLGEAKATGLPHQRDALPSYGERIAASFRAERLRTNSWDQKGQIEREMQAEIDAALGPQPQSPGPRRSRIPEPAWSPASRARKFGQVAELRAFDPAFGALPDSEEAFAAEADRRYRAAWEDQQKVLAAAGEGSWSAELVGQLGAGASDPVALAMLPLGVGGGLARTAATEFVLGAAGEGLMGGQKHQAEDTLGIERSNDLVDMAVAGLSGAALGSAAWGLGRYVQYRRGRSAGRPAPEGLTPGQSETRIAETRDALERGAAPDAVERAAPAGRPLSFQDFDFGPQGNASPRTNRVGYVFGRLLERGMPPHVAAGFVGNLLAESNLVPHATEARPLVAGSRGGFGIAQWTGPRRRQLEAFADARGRPVEDLDLQIEFLWHELQTSERGAWDRIMQAGDATEAALLVSRHYERPGIPREGHRIAHAESIQAQVDAGGVPTWKRLGISGAAAETPADFAHNRHGFTGTGQVTTSAGRRVDVAYEVVDLSILPRAAGDLQPRDRSRAASDAQVGEIAAALDPARLMPSPEADRGAPIVGPDDVIESGNGRVMAIERVYAEHPERAAAYRAQIEAAGFAVPEGMERPALIARRTSDLDASARQAFVREANISATARMSATERSAADARLLTPQALSLFRPGPIASPANRDFVRAALDGLPAAERGALVDAGGALNREGIQRLQQALFAQAWDAPDILARYAETDAGELRGLMEALEQASPAWAALRAEIAAGRLRPEFDITPQVLDAMRMIATAREIAAAESRTMAGALDDLLAQVDLLEGPVHPLTARLVEKFWRRGRAAPKEEIAGFLTRYAEEARRIGSPEAGLFDAPAPRDALAAIDRETFGDLPEDMGAARVAPEAAPITAPPEGSFADGALSPEAEAADQVAREALDVGPFGPIHRDLAGKPEEAIARLLTQRTGEVPNALSHPDVPAPIDLIYGEAPGPWQQGFGLAKIAAKHPEVLNDLQGFLSRLKKDEAKSGPNRIRLTDEEGQAVVRLDYDGQSKTWLMTAYEKRAGKGTTTDTALDVAPDDTAGPGPDASQNIGPAEPSGNPDPADAAIAAEIGRLRAEAPEMEIEIGGQTWRLSELLDDLDQDQRALDAVSTCALPGQPAGGPA